MKNYTIQEKFTLPSHGKVYDVPVKEEITLRSMQLHDEMRRTSPSQNQYQAMCETIDACMVDNPGISAYDMCLGDYQFLVHKLRAVTFGTSYKLGIQCPNCKNVLLHEMDLDELEVLEYTDEFENAKVIKLPQCEAEVELKVQTPRILDDIERKRTEALAKDFEQIDPRLELMLIANIDKVNGKTLNRVQLENFVQQLSLNDVNYIIKSADKLNGLIGIDTTIGCHCGKCGSNFVSTFRFTPEFYSPSID